MKTRTRKIHLFFLITLIFFAQNVAAKSIGVGIKGKHSRISSRLELQNGGSGAEFFLIHGLGPNSELSLNLSWVYMTSSEKFKSDYYYDYQREDENGFRELTLYGSWRYFFKTKGIRPFVDFGVGVQRFFYVDDTWYKVKFSWATFVNGNLGVDVNVTESLLIRGQIGASNTGTSNNNRSVNVALGFVFWP